VLIVDDDVDSASSLRDLVAAESFTVALAHTLRDARRQIALQPPDLVLLDLQLPDGSGLDLFSDPELVASSELVLITGHASLETSIEALRLGAADYIVKPIVLRQLQGVLSRFMKPAALKADVARMNAGLASKGHFGHLWGQAQPMLRVYEQISRVAGTAVTVFITGESGTGKEVVAQTVHDLSRRRKQPFLAVNCGAISPNLIESEIFGHEKGSFTGRTGNTWASSNARMAARCSSTKSPRCRWSCRSSCCACSRPAASCASARPRARKPTCA
jgi:DNA-binding NtrC family response regulator